MGAVAQLRHRVEVKVGGGEATRENKVTMWAILPLCREPAATGRAGQRKRGGVRWKNGCHAFIDRVARRPPADHHGPRPLDGVLAPDHRLPRRYPDPPPGVVHAPGRPFAARVPRPCARAPACSTPASSPNWPPRSPCSRSAGTTWTPAIFFSDIVIPLQPGRGRRRHRARRRPGAGRARCAPRERRARAAPHSTDAALDPIREAVALTVAELGSTPLIGFAGAPFTLAAYMVEGGPSRDHLGPRTMMHAEPEAWHALASWAADASGAFLRAQIEAGASRRAAVRLLGRRPVAWPTTALRRRRIRPGPGPCPRPAAMPLVHFGTGTGELLAAMRDVGADVVGVDYRMPLDEANRRLGGTTPLQGNIDPALLSAPGRCSRRTSARSSRRRRARPGPRGQPRPRGAAGHRPGGPDPGGRAHPLAARVPPVSPRGDGRRGHARRRDDRTIASNGGGVLAARMSPTLASSGPGRRPDGSRWSRPRTRVSGRRRGLDPPPWGGCRGTGRRSSSWTPARNRSPSAPPPCASWSTSWAWPTPSWPRPGGAWLYLRTAGGGPGAPCARRDRDPGHPRGPGPEVAEALGAAALVRAAADHALPVTAEAA